MKKIIALALSVLCLLLVLVSCGNTPAAPTEATETAEPDECAIYGHEYKSELRGDGYTYNVCVICGNTTINNSVPRVYIETLDKYVSYADAQKEFDEFREYKNSAEYGNFDKFTDYLPNDPTAKGLLTQEEIDALRTTDPKGQNTITHDEAVADVELYFKALKYAYGAYYYFGGDEAFGAAKEQVLKELEGVEKTDGAKLGKMIYNSVIFVRDSHFHVSSSTPAADTKVRYEYFYCKGQNYALDDGGYYKLINGEKWYYVGCDSENVTMKYSLDDEGHIVYSPVRFCPKYTLDGERLPDTNVITLKRGDETMTQTAKWIESTPYGNTHSVDFKYAKENGIAYISIRAFPTSEGGAIDEYIATGADVKDAKVIIYDTRSNGGGSSWPSENWVKNLSDVDEVKLKIAFSTKRNALWSFNRSEIGKEYFDHFISNVGKMIPNDIPIIFLTDDLSGSSGESVWINTTQLKNVTVIGSNTNGCMLCGNIHSFVLPNSKVDVYFGQSLQFYYDSISKDGHGLEPDIWCNPKDALDMAYKFIVTNGLATEADVNAIKAKMK